MKNLFLVLILVFSISFCYAGSVDREGLGSHLVGKTIDSNDTLKSVWLAAYQWDTYNLFMNFLTFGDSVSATLDNIPWSDSCAVLIEYQLSPSTDIVNGKDTTTDGYWKLNTGGWTTLDSIVVADSVNGGRIWLSVTGTAALAPGVCRSIQFRFRFGTDHDSLIIEEEPYLLKYKD